MSLYEEIKNRMIDCMRSGESIERDILRTLVGEIQAKSVSSGEIPTDEMVEKMLVSFKENALECIRYAHQDDPLEAVDSFDSNYEIAIYDKFLPQYETVESIVMLLAPNVEQLKSAKDNGPATGMAISILKKLGKKIQGKDVMAAVSIIRGK